MVGLDSPGTPSNLPVRMYVNSIGILAGCQQSSSEGCIPLCQLVSPQVNADAGNSVNGSLNFGHHCHCHQHTGVLPGRGSSSIDQHSLAVPVTPGLSVVYTRIVGSANSTFVYPSPCRLSKTVSLRDWVSPIQPVIAGGMELVMSSASANMPYQGWFVGIAVTIIHYRQDIIFGAPDVLSGYRFTYRHGRCTLRSNGWHYTKVPSRMPIPFANWADYICIFLFRWSRRIIAAAEGLAVAAPPVDVAVIVPSSAIATVTVPANSVLEQEKVAIAYGPCSSPSAIS